MVRIQYRFIILFFISSLFLFINSCGSTDKKEDKNSITNQIANEFDGDNTNNYHVILIENFSNQTSEFELNDRLYEKIRSSFEHDGRLKVESTKKNADLLLKGKLLEYLKRPIAYDAFGQTKEYELNLIIGLNLRVNTKRSDEVLFENRMIRYSVKWNTSIPPFENEYDAQERLLEGIKERVMLTVFSGWYSELKTLKELGFDPDREIRKELYDSIRKDLPIEEIRRLKRKYKEIKEEDLE